MQNIYDHGHIVRTLTKNVAYRRKKKTIPYLNWQLIISLAVKIDATSLKDSDVIISGIYKDELSVLSIPKCLKYPNIACAYQFCLNDQNMLR